MQNALGTEKTSNDLELVDRAAGLRELLWQHAAEADRQRTLTPNVVDAMHEAGMFKLMVPRRLGGLETSTSTLFDVLTELGRGCTSASWVAAVLNFAAWQVGLFSEQAQLDVWGENPDARICWVLSPMAEIAKVDGGVRVSGSWPNASGSAQADWAAVGAPVGFGPGGPEFTLALIPMNELLIEDTWYMAGVRGSASNTLVVKDVFVPDHRLLPLHLAMQGQGLGGHPDERLYSSSYGIGALALLASQLGATRTLFEQVAQRADGRPVPAAGTRDQSDWPIFQVALAEASVRIDAAELLARRSAVDIDDAAQTGALPSDMIRTRLRLDQAWASSELTRAGEILMTEGGTSGYADASPLQRLWRDISTANSHMAFRLGAIQEQYGRGLAGKDLGPIFMG